MARNFPDFITAYLEYAKNEVVPDQFALWAGLSVLAGALERNVWLVDGKRTTYPNLFVLLVGTPGVGKSQAIGPVEPLLYGIGQNTGTFKILSGIATQAGVCEEMERLSINPKGEQYSSLYYIGSEGSDSALKNHADDFRSTACAMYDCSHLYEKTLKSKKYTIPNPVLNMIVGSTFDFLGSIVDQNSVLGGLASRFTYVIDEKPLPEASTLGLETAEGDPKMRERLIQDLISIHKLFGRFRIERAVLDVHQKWWTKYREEFNGTKSERVRSLLVRKPMLLKKVMMLYAISSGDALDIKTKHIESAIAVVERVTANATRVIVESLIAQKDSQSGFNQIIMQALKRQGGVGTMADVRRALMLNGNDSGRIQSTIDQLLGADMIRVGNDGNIILNINPDYHL